MFQTVTSTDTRYLYFSIVVLNAGLLLCSTPRPYIWSIEVGTLEVFITR